MPEESLVARLRGSASYIDSVAQHGNFAYSGKSDVALLREAADALERAEELRQNHMLAVGIIAGVAFKYDRADLRDTVERMLENLRALSPSSKDETK